jgi:hypothetical protein
MPNEFSLEPALGFRAYVGLPFRSCGSELRCTCRLHVLTFRLRPSSRSLNDLAAWCWEFCSVVTWVESGKVGCTMAIQGIEEERRERIRSWEVFMLLSP